MGMRNNCGTPSGAAPNCRSFECQKTGYDQPKFPNCHNSEMVPGGCLCAFCEPTIDAECDAGWSTRHPKGSFAVTSRMQSQPLGGVVDVQTTTRKITRTTFPWHKNFAQRLIGVSEWHTNLGVSRRGKIK